MRRRLVIGTRNKKKGLELAELVAPLGLDVKTLDDFPSAIDVDETGSTFQENAQLKGITQARHLGEWVLADDSGLAVDALGGAPGVLSARFAGSGATDQANNEKLRLALESISPDRRTAHYVCHVVLVDPCGQVRARAEETCHGRILLEPRGAAGFGYDPYFEIIEYRRTFGELAPAVKACLSHRARALRKILPRVAELIATGEWPAISSEQDRPRPSMDHLAHSQ